MFTMSWLIKLIFFSFPLTSEFSRREQQRFWGSASSDSRARPVPWAAVAESARGGRRGGGCSRCCVLRAPPELQNRPAGPGGPQRVALALPAARVRLPACVQRRVEGKLEGQLVTFHKYYFPSSEILLSNSVSIAFSNSYRALGVQWGRQKSPGMQEGDRIVICPFSERCSGEQLK